MTKLEDAVAARKAARVAALAQGTTVAQAAPGPLTINQSALNVNPRRAEDIAVQQAARSQQTIASQGGTGGIRYEKTEGGVTRDVQTGVYGTAKEIDDLNRPMMESYTDPQTGRSSTRQQVDANGNPMYEKTIERDANGNPIFTYGQASGPLAPQGYNVAAPKTPLSVLGSPTAGAMGQSGNVGFNPNVGQGQSGYGAQGAQTGLTFGSKIQAALQEINDKEAKDIAFVIAKGGMGGAGNVDSQVARIKAEAEAQRNQATKTEVPEQSAGKTPVASSPTTPPAGADAALSQLSQEYPTLANAFQGILDELTIAKQEQETLAQTLLTGGTMNIGGKQVEVQGVQNLYESVDRKIKDQEALAVSTFDKVQGLIKEQQKEEQAYISQQKAADQQRLEWDKNNALRQLADQRDDAIESKIARLALTGGIGSSGGNAEIMGAKTEYNNAMQRVREEYSVQATELSAKYTGLYLQSSSDYKLRSINNIKDAYTAMEKTTEQSMASAKARSDAQNTILSQFVAQQEKNRMDRVTTIKDIVKEMNEEVNRKRDDERAQRTADLAQLHWASQTYGDKTPRSMIDYLKKALPDIDVGGILSTPTIAQGNEAFDRQIALATLAAKDEKDQADTLVSGLIGQMQSGGKDLGALGARALAGRTLRDRMDDAQIMQAKIDAKDEEGMKEQVLLTTYNGFSTKTKGVVDLAVDMDRNVGIIKNYMSQFEEKYGGKWKNAVEKGKSWVEVNKDEKFLSLKAQIEAVQTGMRLQLFGTALSEYELKSALNMFIDWDTDEVRDMETKLDNLKDFTARAAENRYDSKLGVGSYQFLTGKGQGASSSIYDDPNAEFNDSYFENLENLSSPTTFSPLEQTENTVGNVPPLPKDKLMAVLQTAGFTGESLKTAYGIAMAESIGGHPQAVGDTQLVTDKWGPSVGLFQIRTLKDPGNTWYRDGVNYDLTDPLLNAKAAYELSNGGKNWGHWTAYLNGSWKKYRSQLS